MLHCHLNGGLRSGCGVGHCQLFPQEVVLQGKAAEFRLPPLCRFDLAGQKQL